MKKNKTKNPKKSNITQKWVDLLIPFSNNYAAKLTASELSRKSKIRFSASAYFAGIRVLSKKMGTSMLKEMKLSESIIALLFL